MANRFWHLKNSDLFGQLNTEQIERLESQAKIRKYPRKSLVYLPAERSDSVLLLESGRIKMYHLTGDGKQTVLGFVDPGELFGELALLGVSGRDEFAETMESSVIIMIPGKTIQEIMEQHARFSLGVTKLIGLRRRRIERRLKSLLYHSARDRLVHLLLELAEKYGRSASNGTLISVKFSHQDLASVIGSTRETVTSLLGELQLEGVIRIERRSITLTNFETLAESMDFARHLPPQAT